MLNNGTPNPAFGACMCFYELTSIWSDVSDLHVWSSFFTYIKPSSGSIGIICFAVSEPLSEREETSHLFGRSFLHDCPQSYSMSFNLGMNRNRAAFFAWCMFLLHTPCGDSIKQMSPSNRQHSLKSFELIQLSETMNLLLTSMFLFGMGWESGDKSIEQTGTVALNRECYVNILNVLANRDDNRHTPGYIVL